MLLFAPNVFIARYLKETGQLKPEVMAKAEMLMLTGYQRELTYRRTDGSFSAFGQRDKSGSLWLTAFVLKTFAQANGPDLHRRGGAGRARAPGSAGSRRPMARSSRSASSTTRRCWAASLARRALTAYVAVALLEAGDTAAAGRAIGYLEGQLASITDPYALALTTYALGLAKSPRAAAARDQPAGARHRERRRAVLGRWPAADPGRHADADPCAGGTSPPRHRAARSRAQRGDRDDRLRRAGAAGGRRHAQRRARGALALVAAQRAGRLRLDPGHGRGAASDDRLGRDQPQRHRRNGGD